MHVKLYRIVSTRTRATPAAAEQQEGQACAEAEGSEGHGPEAPDQPY